MAAAIVAPRPTPARPTAGPPRCAARPYALRFAEAIVCSPLPPIADEAVLFL
jgi:hypothetical protein